MLRKFDLGVGRRCRIWVGELPPISFRATETVTRTLDRVALEACPAFKAGIEIVIPRGGRTLYGALGVEFISSKDASDLTMLVCLSNEDHEHYAESLIRAVEATIKGLPTEYINAVYAGVEQSLRQERALSAGVLRFAYAAHGRVSSNAPLFQRLAGYLVATKGQETIAYDEQWLRTALLT